MGAGNITARKFSVANIGAVTNRRATTGHAPKALILRE
jgi:hypothetical protein